MPTGMPTNGPQLPIHLLRQDEERGKCCNEYLHIPLLPDAAGVLMYTPVSGATASPGEA